MKKNAMTKIVASLAFFGILISIIGTGLLIIFSEPATQELTPEQIAEIQKMIESQSGATQSGVLLDVQEQVENIEENQEITE